MKKQVGEFGGKLSAVSTQIAQLTAQLKTAQQKATTLDDAIPLSESINPFGRGDAEKKFDAARKTVDSLKATLASLKKDLTGIRSNITALLTKALAASDPAFQARAQQIAALNKAEASSAKFAGVVEQAASRLDDAQTQITIDASVNATEAALGTSAEPVNVGFQASRQLSKDEALDDAKASVAKVGPSMQAWRAEIGSIAAGMASTTTAPGAVSAELNPFIGFARLAGTDVFNAMTATENALASFELSRSQKQISTLAKAVSGYRQEVSAQLKTLQTQQNNHVQALMQQVLK